MQIHELPTGNIEDANKLPFDTGTNTYAVSFSNLATAVVSKVFSALTTTAKTILGAINELKAADDTLTASISNINSALAWKSAGTATGTSTISVPETATEISVAVQYNSTATFFNFHLTSGILATSQRTFTTGYYLSASAFAFVQIIASRTAVQLGTVNITGVNHTSTSNIIVYYR